MTEEGINIELDDKNVIVMKLLHYFITDRNYNPIILQGAENEIWLENMNEDYKIVRIVSNYIHNDEQFKFDMFKTKRIVRKIKKKTFTFSMNTLSIFLNLGENVNLSDDKKVSCIKVEEENDLDKNSLIKSEFPDLFSKLTYSEKGVELFLKITNDINNHNKDDAKKAEEVFKTKYPVVTYTLIALNIILYVVPMMFGTYESVIEKFCVYGPLIKNGEVYRLITGGFLHGGLMHLLFNCYALYVIGMQLESFLGKTKYLCVYFFSMITASLFSVLFNGTGASVGASGAIFGLMGSLVYFGYHYRVYLGNIIKSQIIPLIVLNLVIGFLSTGIDNAAHIGGLVGGALITMGLGVKYKSSTFEKINGLIVSTLYLAFLIFMIFFYQK